jgi:hypothetical protein
MSSLNGINGMGDGTIFHQNFRSVFPIYARSRGDKIRIETWITHPTSSFANGLGWAFFYFTYMFQDRTQCWMNAQGKEECQGLWHTSNIYLNKFGPLPGMAGHEDITASWGDHPIPQIAAYLAPGSRWVKPCNGSKYFYGINPSSMDPTLQLPAGFEAVRPNETYYCAELSGTDLEAGLVAINNARSQLNTAQQQHCSQVPADCPTGFHPIPLMSTNPANYVFGSFNLNAEVWDSEAGPSGPGDPRMGLAFRDMKVSVIQDATGNIPYGYVGLSDGNLVSGWACDFDAFYRPLDVHFWVSNVLNCPPAQQGTADGEPVCFLGATTANQPRPDAAFACYGSPNTGFSWRLPTAQLAPNVPHKIHSKPINYPSGANLTLYVGNPPARVPLIY